MALRNFNRIWATLIWLFISQSSIAATRPHLIIKSIGSQNIQKIWSLADEERSDIRYDSDGDHQIDEWLLVKDNLKINIYFTDRQISKVRFSLKKSSTYLQALYVFDKHVFTLQNTWAIEKPISFTAASIDPAVTHLSTLSKRTVLCASSRNPSPITTDDALFITDSLYVTKDRSRWDDAIDSSCLSGKETIKGALRDVFDFPAIPQDQKNQFVECLSANSKTKPLVTEFTRIITKGPGSSAVEKIECKKTTSLDCGIASYQSSEGIINLPISKPPCSSDMRSVYRKQIYHESLHSINPCLSEGVIVKIVDSCEKSKGHLFKGSEISNSLTNELDRCDFNHKKLESAAANVAKTTAQTQNSIAESAQLKLTNIPKSIAEGSLAIPAPEPQTPGMVALNNSFQESRAPASASVTIPLQQSIAMSAPFFKAAAKVFSNYKLEPMQGQAPIPTQLASQKTPRAVAAPVITETLQAAKIPSAEPASFAKSDNSKPTAPESIEANPAPTKPEAQAQAARSPEVGSGGARGIASAPSANSSNSVAAKPRVSDDASIDQERAKVAQNLVKMSIPQAREYIKSNEGNLERLKILILSQKNQRWGYKDPSRAAVLIQEVNGQLRIESQ